MGKQLRKNILARCKKENFQSRICQGLPRERAIEAAIERVETNIVDSMEDRQYMGRWMKQLRKNILARCKKENFQSRICQGLPRERAIEAAIERDETNIIGSMEEDRWAGFMKQLRKNLLESCKKVEFKP